MKAVCLVPRRSDGGRRDAIWSFVKARWEANHPDIPVFEGHHDEGKFNRSLAVNRAAEQAGGWDIAVISDSDSFVGAEQITDALWGAAGRCGFWLAYDCFHYLSRSMSDRIMDGYAGYWGADNGIEWTMAGTCSSMVVVRRDVWDQVGGMDDGFEGWGFEDVAFSHALQTFAGGVNRVSGPAWHLHHPSSPENNHQDPVWIANRERMMRYHAVSYDQTGMRALLDELHGTRV